MTAKKNTSKAKKPSVVIVQTDDQPEDPTKAWQNSEGRLHLAKIDLLELSNLRNKIDAMLSSSRLIRLKADKMEQDAILKARQMRQQAHSHEKQRMEVENEYQQLTNRLSKKYELNFQKIGYDDMSGMITILEPDDEDSTK